MSVCWTGYSISSPILIYQHRYTPHLFIFTHTRKYIYTNTNMAFIIGWTLEWFKNPAQWHLMGEHFTILQRSRNTWETFIHLAQWFHVRKIHLLRSGSIYITPTPNGNFPTITRTNIPHQQPRSHFLLHQPLSLHAFCVTMTFHRRRRLQVVVIEKKGKAGWQFLLLLRGSTLYGYFTAEAIRLRGWRFKLSVTAMK